MSISAFASGLSGLHSFQTALDSSANNVANIDTPGYRPEQADFQDIANGGVNAVVTTPHSPSAASISNTPSGTDYATEAVNSLQYQFGFDVSAQAVKAAEHNLGTLINITA
ncbi:MAG TPA: flagellar basal body protein [Burkholderiaceae bacterium]|jgi:flagellar hook protein FlgE|nr:flagellar basal body protein [Burkholderiaceae bacterium]